MTATLCHQAASRSVLTLFSVLVLAVSVSAQPAPARGQLLIIGGGDRPASIMELFARLAGGARGKVLVFPQASERAEAGVEIATEMKSLGIGDVVVMTVDRAGAETDDALRLADGATGVYFGGGDQARLMSVLHGTRLEQTLRRLYQDGAVMSGTSAGAAVMSRVMITGDERRPVSKDESWQRIEADSVVTSAGLGLLDDAIVDQHFVRRRRYGRLISLVLEQPQLLGVAIDEATAVWVKPDRTFEVVGDGPVLVLDASDATVARDPGGTGLRGSGLRLDVLREGARYDLATRTLLRLGPEAKPALAAR
jgi:cyanophycinase